VIDAQNKSPKTANIYEGGGKGLQDPQIANYYNTMNQQQFPFIQQSLNQFSTSSGLPVQMNQFNQLNQNFIQINNINPLQNPPLITYSHQGTQVSLIVNLMYFIHRCRLK
jgi:hypothetical protein